MLLLGTLWGLKRYGGLQARRDQDDSFIKVLDKKVLAPRQQAAVIEVDDQRFLIGIGSHGLQRLGQWKKPLIKSFEETLDDVDNDIVDSNPS